jgi:hypothetical protein
MLLSVADDPVESVPLSMLILASVQSSWWARRAPRAVVAAQFSDALRRLGFEAELLRATVTVSREDLSTVPAVSLGLPTIADSTPSAVSADGSH